MLGNFWRHEIKRKKPYHVEWRKFYFKCYLFHLDWHALRVAVVSQQMAHGCKGCWGGDGGARAVWRVSRDPCITLASRCFSSVVTQDICRSRSPEDRTIFRGSNVDRVTKVGSSFTQKKSTCDRRDRDGWLDAQWRSIFKAQRKSGKMIFKLPTETGKLKNNQGITLSQFVDDLALSLALSSFYVTINFSSCLGGQRWNIRLLNCMILRQVVTTTDC